MASLSSSVSAAVSRLLLAVMCCVALFGTAQAQEESKKVKAVTVTLVADTKAIEAGKPFTAGVEFQIDPEWDIYWQFVGDIGLATQIQWELPPGFTAGELQWPLPVSHTAAGDFLNYVYLHEALLFTQITPPAQLPEGPIAIKAKIKWQMCDPQTCVPGNATLALSLPGGSVQPNNADLFTKWRAQLPKTTGTPFEVKWDRSKAEEFSLHISGLAKEFKAEFFPLPPKGVKPGHPKISEIAADGSRTITFPFEEGGAPNLPLKGVLVTNTGNAPREGWLIDSTAPTSALVPAPDAKSSTGSTSSTTSTPPASTTGSGTPNLFAILWSAFLGGLILNLMPCVLPVIALKIFGFVQQAGQEPRRVFRLGLAFVGGVFGFFIALAMLITVLRFNGVNLNWGFQFQHVGVFVGLITLVFVFGLNLLGVFEVALAHGTSSTLSDLSSREGYSGAFLHGLFTTLLGTSCTAPFLGFVLGFAFVAPAPVVFLIFLAIAAGMSLPYFLLTANPKWMRFIPKPGTWMERLKQVMGFVMLAVVVWLLGVFGGGRGVEPLIAVCSFLLVVGVACWAFGAFHGKAIAWILPIVLTVAGYFFFLDGKLAAAPQAGAANQPTTKDGITWQPWSNERVTEATKSGQPVFIDFTADWCLNCKYNEKAVLSTEPVREALKAKKVLTLKADWTNGEPAITEVLRRYGRAGVPVYLLYPGGNAEPVLLPEILTQNTVLNELNRLKN